MNTVEKYNARLQAIKEEMDGITPEVKVRATEAKCKKDAPTARHTGICTLDFLKWACEGRDGLADILCRMNTTKLARLAQNSILRGISMIKHTDHDLKITRTEDGGPAWVDESHAYPNSDLTLVDYAESVQAWYEDSRIR